MGTIAERLNIDKHCLLFVKILVFPNCVPFLQFKRVFEGGEQILKTGNPGILLFVWNCHLMHEGTWLLF